MSTPKENKAKNLAEIIHRLAELRQTSSKDEEQALSRFRELVENLRRKYAADEYYEDFNIAYNKALDDVKELIGGVK